MNSKDDIVITINDIVMRCEITRSKRKTLSISVSADEKIIAKAPLRMSHKEILRFIESKQQWILERYQKADDNIKNRIMIEDENERNRFIELARQELNKKAIYYSELMAVHYNRIAIKEQKTCWGSCSAKGNLNFNWKLILMPEEILNYVVVHELAHLIEMNHSQRFWEQVQKYCINYRECRQWLRENGGRYL